MCVCVCGVCARARVRACVYNYMCACVRVCVCVQEDGGTCVNVCVFACARAHGVYVYV